MAETTWTPWNPWKIATVVIAAVVTTALVTGLVVANLNGNGKETPKPIAQSAADQPAVAQSATNGPRAPSRHAGTAPRVANGPSSTDVLEKALIGGALGAGVGAAGGGIAAGGKGAGKGAAIGGIVGATAGTLYGLHDK